MADQSKKSKTGAPEPHIVSARIGISTPAIIAGIVYLGVTYRIPQGADDDSRDELTKAAVQYLNHAFTTRTDYKRIPDGVPEFYTTLDALTGDMLVTIRIPCRTTGNLDDWPQDQFHFPPIADLTSTA